MYFNHMKKINKNQKLINPLAIRDEEEDLTEIK